MISGRKHNGDLIAQEFARILEKNKSLFKTASHEGEVNMPPSSEEPKPEDFLISSTEQADVGHALDNKIQEMSSYADDKEMCAVCKCEKGKCKCVKQESDADDCSYLIDAHAKEVLFGLGKVAADLRGKNERFAADLVEATAVSIKKDVLEEARKKAYVLNSLTKMAKEFYTNGNILAGDMVSVTIENIKK
jgi:hypothetical protein